MSKRGIVIVISGPSGSGKGTVVKELRAICPTMQVSVSATTRQPREGEQNGVDYYFKTREEFEGLIERGEVLEYTQYNGNYYGTLKSEAERIISEGDDLILEIEVDGGGQIKRLMGDRVCGIMLIAPDAAEQENRLRGRGTESEEVIKGRLSRAREEILEAPNYDY
ncbi:MAG: guanylate kinase, partial [Clostridia bacterium]|nr:guanylate kinase [Clostridia bacterium]